MMALVMVSSICGRVVRFFSGSTKIDSMSSGSVLVRPMSP
jgi:hypothetical protein